jgi:hypothetical protein
MKFLTAFVVAAAFAAAAPAGAVQGGATTLFSCRTGGKTATVTASGPRLTYRFGTRRAAELTIQAGPRTGNVFFMRQRYASIETQIRFTRGGYSYILYSMGASVVADSNAVSGLVVMRGNRRISDRSCTPHAEFSADYAYDALPEDNERFTAM